MSSKATMIPLLLLLLSALIPPTKAWFSCADDLWPQELRLRRNHAKPERFKQNPFYIEVRGRDSLESYVYSRSEEFNVRIRGGPFSWAEVHVRSVLFPHVVVGEFLDPLTRYFQARSCAGKNRSSVVTPGDVTVSRRHGPFVWRAPSSTKVGPLVIVSRIFEDGKSFLVQSPFLSPNDAKMDASSCGKQYGCARIGRKQCEFGESCRISIRWRCFRSSVLVEASFRGHSPAAFGFTTNRNKGALCTARSPTDDNPRISFREYYLFRNHGFPLSSSNATFLRGKGDAGSAICRFEIPRPRGESPSLIYGRVDIYGHPIHLKQKRLIRRNFCDPYAYPISNYRGRQTFLNLAKLASAASKTIAQLPALGMAFLVLVPIFF